MSIATRTGDDGTTGLMFGHRVPKTDARIEAYGAIDELSAALGLARSFREDRWTSEELFRIQKELVIVMGELAVRVEDRQRYAEKGFKFVDEAMVRRLDQSVVQLEARGARCQDWDIPGATPMSAALHMARTVCRRAERDVLRLGEDVRQLNPWVARYLNRLSDLLWLCARVTEDLSGRVPQLV